MYKIPSIVLLIEFQFFSTTRNVEGSFAPYKE